MTTPKQIEKQLAALERGDNYSWGQVATLLEQIDTSGFWHRDSDSFTAWLNTHASKFGVKPPMLWRHLTSGRYLKQLGDKASGQGVVIPPLEAVSEVVSSETVELLAKLERVMAGEDFGQLLERALKGDVRRMELRDLWETYRPVLRGKTARGRGVVAPRVNRKDPEQFQSLMEAEILGAFRAAGSGWTGCSKSDRYEVFLHVTPERRPTDRLRYTFPAVAMVKVFDDTTQYHGIVFDTFVAPHSEEISRFVSGFVDYLWVVLRRPNFSHNEACVHRCNWRPDGAGVLDVVGGHIEVIAPAEPREFAATRKGDLISELLTRSGRR